MKRLRIAAGGLVVAMMVVLALAAPCCAQTKAVALEGDSTLSFAICPIVYPVDQAPGDRGYHYIFYGNAFFVNEEGYLLTAAHVLSQLNEAQPYVVLRRATAPPRMLAATVVDVDQEHDVALLRVTPNPFEGKYQVRTLQLVVEIPGRGHAVLAAAVRPSRLRNPQSFDAFSEDRPAGEVLGYEFFQLEKGRAETELLLFGHEVLLGDSGAPVVSAETEGVVGLVEGRWLRPNAAALGAGVKQSSGGVAAVVPIHYAIALLQEHGVSWHSAPGTTLEPAAAGKLIADNSTPVPLSLVAAPYPSQALLGGEVVLDAMVDNRGRVGDIKVVQGGPPFVDKVLSAVRSWSFVPARVNGEGVEARIGIAFRFEQPVSTVGEKPAALDYVKPVADASERGPLPIQRVDADASAISASEGSVILSAQIDAQGHPAAVRIVRDSESLGGAMATGIGQWKFAPGKRDGMNCAATFVAVEIFRGGAVPSHAQGKLKSQILVQ
jgi:TonB family protein